MIDELTRYAPHHREADASHHTTTTEDALIGRLTARLDDVESRVGVLEARERALLGYVSVLRFHIDSGKGPPAPDWPEGLV